MQRRESSTLEGVFAGGASVFQRSLSGSHEAGAVGGAAFEGSFSFERTPGFGAHASQCDAYVLYLPFGQLHNDGARDESKLVGRAIAQLEIKLSYCLPPAAGGSR